MTFSSIHVGHGKPLQLISLFSSFFIQKNWLGVSLQSTSYLKPLFLLTALRLVELNFYLLFLSHSCLFWSLSLQSVLDDVWLVLTRVTGILLVCFTHLCSDMLSMESLPISGCLYHCHLIFSLWFTKSSSSFVQGAFLSPSVCSCINQSGISYNILEL